MTCQYFHSKVQQLKSKLNWLNCQRHISFQRNRTSRKLTSLWIIVRLSPIFLSPPPHLVPILAQINFPPKKLNVEKSSGFFRFSSWNLFPSVNNWAHFFFSCREAEKKITAIIRPWSRPLFKAKQVFRTTKLIKCGVWASTAIFCKKGCIWGLCHKLWVAKF